MPPYAVHVPPRADLGAAPKHQLLERLYERFARDLDAARAALEARDIAGTASAIDHALRIVRELATALDHEAAPELCASLAALYELVMHRLAEAKASLGAAPLDQAARVMTELGMAFRRAHGR